MTAFRVRMRWLYELVRRPTYRSLAAHAGVDGLTLRPSTIGDLLNGPGTPRWETVEAFVRACARHARVHRIAVPEGGVDLDPWHAAYRALESGPAGRGGRRQQLNLSSTVGSVDPSAA